MGGEVFPVAVHVAVAVEGAGEAGALELPGVDVEVLLAQPGRERAGGETVAQLTARGDEVRVGLALGRHGVGGQGRVEAREPASDIGLDLRLGAAGLLEVGDVELLLGAADPVEDLGGAGAAGRRVRDAQQADRAEDVGVEQGEGAHDGDVVLHQVEHAVGVGRGGLGGAAVAAYVDRHCPVSGRGEGRELAAPGVPGLGEAVHQQDQRAGALLDQVQAPGRGLDGAVAE